MNGDQSDIDKQLFSQVAEGDDLAFRELYHRYARLLFPFLLKLTKSDHTTDELIQEVFLRVWVNRDQLSEIDNPKAWLYKIAGNQAHNWFNRNILEKKAVLRRQYDIQNQQSPDSDLHFREIVRAIQTAVEQLPSQRRVIYRMNREQGMRAADIASQLNISVSTVKNTLAAALRSIREQLEALGYLPVIFACSSFL